MTASHSLENTFDILVLEPDNALYELLAAWASEVQVGGLKAVLRRVTTAAALQDELADKTPDLLICDIDGRGDAFADVSDDIRALRQGHPSLPCFVFSAEESFKSRLKAVRAGASYYFLKPLTGSSHGANGQAHTQAHTESKALFQRKLRGAMSPGRPTQKLIVIAEDDPVQTQLYQRVLESHGFRVAVATEPQEAFRLLQEKDIGMLIADIHMPGCSGIELGQIVRQHEALEQIPILFMSDDSAIDTRIAAINIANDEFIQKPVEPWRLLMLVESRMRRLSRADSCEW